MKFFGPKRLKLACIFLFVFIFVFINACITGSHTTHLQYDSIHNIPVNVVFLSTGPRHFEKVALRVGIFMEEVYPNILIQKILYGKTEGDPDTIVFSKILPGFDVAKQLGFKNLMRLEFVKWNTWNEFIMQDYQTRFSVKYMSDQKIIVTDLKPINN